MVLSSVIPKPTGFGEIVLHRHLSNEPRLDVTVTPDPGWPRLMRLLRRGPTRSTALALEVLNRGRRWDLAAKATFAECRPGIILTVAHGDGASAALRLARQTNVPLVTIFHDWWPDLPAAVGWARPSAERQFRALYDGSRVALCVSAGMRRALGPHSDARTLIPIPGECRVQPVATAKRPGEQFRIHYAGNLREYGPMLREVLAAAGEYPRLRFEVRGPTPSWPAGFKQKMQAAGTWLEFAPREQFETWLAEADAFLVTMSFEPKLRRQSETAFPSKLLEFARFGRPMVIWAPDYSTAVAWGRSKERALCVTDSNPAALLAALARLAGNTAEQSRLGNEALAAARGEFNPAHVQDAFVAALQTAAGANRGVLAGQIDPVGTLRDPAPVA